MKFRTEIKIREYPVKIDYHSKIFGLGSCFVDNIKEKLDYYSFSNLINPFGVVFNPYSIKRLFERIIRKEYFTRDELFFHENLWKNFDLHSRNNRADAQKFLEEANGLLIKSHEFLKTSGWVFVTLGTAWVYKSLRNNQIVNNCHKIDQKEFVKFLLSPEEIQEMLKESIKLIKSFNPNANILFSISPVRHLKDGFVENNRSKSHLHAALHPLIKSNIFYFPSYEILMDDLRDYRFYSKDMLHPNEIALEYIWEKFTGAMINPQIKEDMKIIESIKKHAAHRPFQEAKEYPLKIRKKMDQIHKKYPGIYKKLMKL